MRVTLLGSAEAVGVPAPLCACEFCAESERRRRPGLLVETEHATVVLDAGPDLKEQLHETGTDDVDAVFLTHHHFDHVGGLHDLAHAAMGFDEHVVAERLDGEFADDEKPDDPEFAVYLSETALEHLRSSTPHLLDSLDVRTLDSSDELAVGDLTVRPFPVDHARPAFDTLGFAVNHDGTKVVYAPDMKQFGTGADETTGRSDAVRDGDTAVYANADLLFVEGAALFRAYGHGDEATLRGELSTAAAERTVLVNLSEHLQRMTTDDLRDAAAVDRFELGADFAVYEP